MMDVVSQVLLPRTWCETRKGTLISSIVFSAPRYCDSTENKGAYINIGPDLKLQFNKFDAVPHPDVPAMVCLSSPFPGSSY
jgi:hypothetical protein